MAIKRLIFLGAPGTGKGTQAARVQKRLGYTHISSGDTVRREIQAGTELGKQVEEYFVSGKLVPDDLITNVVLQAVEKVPADGGFILDGFPRTVPQAESLGEFLQKRSRPLDAVIMFEMHPAEIIQRLSSRRVCTDCQATYNLLFLPPKQEGVCDRCGGRLLQRADDRADVIATRLETYEKQTRPLIEYYARKGLLRSVQAAASADQVEAALLRILEGSDPEA